MSKRKDLVREMVLTLNAVFPEVSLQVIHQAVIDCNLDESAAIDRIIQLTMTDETNEPVHDTEEEPQHDEDDNELISPSYSSEPFDEEQAYNDDEDEEIIYDEDEGEGYDEAFVESPSSFQKSKKPPRSSSKSWTMTNCWPIRNQKYARLAVRCI